MTKRTKHIIDLPGYTPNKRGVLEGINGIQSLSLGGPFTIRWNAAECSAEYLYESLLQFVTEKEKALDFIQRARAEALKYMRDACREFDVEPMDEEPRCLSSEEQHTRYIEELLALQGARP